MSDRSKSRFSKAITLIKQGKWEELKQLCEDLCLADPSMPLKMLAEMDHFLQMNALHVAAQEGAFEIVEFILDLMQSPLNNNILSVDADSTFGSPLLLAVKMGHTRVACLLLLNGANPSFVCPSDLLGPMGSCPLKEARSRNYKFLELLSILEAASKNDLKPACDYLSRFKEPVFAQFVDSFKREGLAPPKVSFADTDTPKVEVLPADDADESPFHSVYFVEETNLSPEFVTRTAQGGCRYALRGSAHPDEKKIRQLAREGACLMKLSHENIIPVAGLCDLPPQLGFCVPVFTYPLSSVCRERRLNNGIELLKIKSDQLLQWIRGIVSAAKFVHDKGLTIPDLALASFFLFGDQAHPSVKLVDVTGMISLDKRLECSPYTTSIAKIRYLAPELFGGPVSEDNLPNLMVCNVAMTIFELLHGTDNWLDEVSVSQAIIKRFVQKEEPQLKSSFSPLGNLLTRCWSPCWKERPRLIDMEQFFGTVSPPGVFEEAMDVYGFECVDVLASGSAPSKEYRAFGLKEAIRTLRQPLNQNIPVFDSENIKLAYEHTPVTLRGGSCEVKYVRYHMKPFAAKIPFKNNKASMERQIMEANLLLQAKCDHVIGLDSVFLDYENEKVILVLERADQTLDEFLNEISCPFIALLKVSLELVEGLKAIHDKGIAHKDIREDNILMKGGHPLFCDLNVSVDFSDETLSPSTIESAMMGDCLELVRMLHRMLLGHMERLSMTPRQRHQFKRLESIYESVLRKIEKGRLMQGGEREDEESEEEPEIKKMEDVSEDMSEDDATDLLVPRMKELLFLLCCAGFH